MDQHLLAMYNTQTEADVLDTTSIGKTCRRRPFPSTGISQWLQKLEQRRMRQVRSHKTISMREDHAYR